MKAHYEHKLRALVPIFKPTIWIRMHIHAGQKTWTWIMHIHKINKMQTLESLYNLKSKIACDAGAYCLNRLQHITSFFESQVYALKKMPKEMHQYTWEIYHQISTSKGREKILEVKKKT